MEKHGCSLCHYFHSATMLRSSLKANTIYHAEKCIQMHLHYMLFLFINIEHMRISSKNQTGLCMMMAHSPLIDTKLTHYTYIQMHTGKDQNMYCKEPDWQN